MAMRRAPSSTTCLLPHSELDRCHPYPLPPHPSSAPAASPAPPATRDPGGVPTSQSPPRPPPTSAARPAQWWAEAASPATTTHPPSPPPPPPDAHVPHRAACPSVALLHLRPVMRRPPPHRITGPTHGRAGTPGPRGRSRHDGSGCEIDLRNDNAKQDIVGR